MSVDFRARTDEILAIVKGEVDLGPMSVEYKGKSGGNRSAMAERGIDGKSSSARGQLGENRKDKESSAFAGVSSEQTTARKIYGRALRTPTRYLARAFCPRD